MKILGFIALTQKMMQLTRATDGIVGEALKEGRNSASELTENEQKVFQDLFYTQRKIEEWQHEQSVERTKRLRPDLYQD